MFYYKWCSVCQHSCHMNSLFFKEKFCFLLILIDCYSSYEQISILNILLSTTYAVSHVDTKWDLRRSSFCSLDHRRYFTFNIVSLYENPFSRSSRFLYSLIVSSIYAIIETRQSTDVHQLLQPPKLLIRKQKIKYSLITDIDRYRTKGREKARNYTRPGREGDDRSHASVDLRRVPTSRYYANVSNTRHVNAFLGGRNSNGRQRADDCEGAGWTDGRLRGGGEPKEFQSGGAIMSKLSWNMTSYRPGWKDLRS